MSKLARRFAAVLLAALLVSGCAVRAYAAEHGTVDYQDMVYERYDTERFYEKQAEVKRLLEENGSKEELLAAYNGLVSEISDLETLYVLCQNSYYRDVNNSWYREESEWMYECVNTIYDEFLQTVSLILNSEYGEVLLEQEGEELSLYTDYEAMTQEEMDLAMKEQQLTAEYDQALLSEEEDRYDRIGDIFTALVGVRTEMAEYYGYDNYADYSYEIIYSRDYSTEDAAYLYSYVKAYIVPVYVSLMMKFDSSVFEALESFSYGGEEALLDLLEPYMGRISEKLSEAYSYMRQYHLYDWDVDAKKMSIGYTTYLPSYHAPFTFNASDGSFYDVTTMIHEFGHYNEFYQNGQTKYYQIDSIDVSEVHSQALELLFLAYYPEIFPEITDEVTLYTMYAILSGIVDGCLYDEFQYEVYTNPQMSAQEITDLYRELAEEYGMELSGSLAYQWMEIPHTFHQPMYYISYAVSAAAALEIWEVSLDDRQAGIDIYLDFVELGCNTGIRTALLDCGLKNVLLEDTIREIAESTAEYLGLDVEYGEWEEEERGGLLSETSETFLRIFVIAAVLLALYGIRLNRRYR